MNSIEIFEKYAQEYDEWFDVNRFAYQSEVLALKKFIPENSKSLEVGVGTGRFAVPLGIKVGIEPAKAMADIARKRGIEVYGEGGSNMKIGIVVYSNDSETVWNAFRFTNFALKAGDEVKVFLLGKGVECESLDTDKFKVTEQMQTLVDNGGEIFACGSCIKIRQSEGSEMCPLSTMKDLYEIIKECDKVVTF